MAEMVLQGSFTPILFCLLIIISLSCFRFIQLSVPHQVGLKGESLSLHSISGSSSVEWIQGNFVSRKQPLMWYKVSITNFEVAILVNFSNL